MAWTVVSVLSQEQIERGRARGGREAAAGSIESIDIRPTTPYAEVGHDRQYEHYESKAPPPVRSCRPRPASGRYDNNQNQGFEKNLYGNLPSETTRYHEWYIEGRPT